MDTFATRLQQTLTKKGLSQRQFSELCGISQQSLSYILTNNLNKSKLAPQLATALDIDYRWLADGIGSPDPLQFTVLPLLQSPRQLKQFIQGNLNKETTEKTLISENLTDKAFAYLLDLKKMVICTQNAKKTHEYLSLIDANICVTKDEHEHSFPIYEWRIRHEEF